MFLVPLTRRNAELARGFDRLFDDSLFDRLTGNNRGTTVATRSPALDVTEAERSYTVTLDLPGVAKQDVKIAIDGRNVTVEAHSTQTTEHKDGERVLYTERSAASYARSFTLPQEVDQAESSARLDQGVLTLQLTKRSANKAAQLTVN